MSNVNLYKRKSINLFSEILYPKLYILFLLLFTVIAVAFLIKELRASIAYAQNPTPASKCTQEWMVCSDNSMVSRSGNACEFAQCPGGPMSYANCPVSLKCPDGSTINRNSWIDCTFSSCPGDQAPIAPVSSSSSPVNPTSIITSTPGVTVVPSGVTVQPTIASGGATAQPAAAAGGGGFLGGITGAIGGFFNGAMGFLQGAWNFIWPIIQQIIPIILPIIIPIIVGLIAGMI